MVTISFMHEILIISFMAEIVMITLQQKIMITRDGGMRIPHCRDPVLAGAVVSVATIDILFREMVPFSNVSLADQMQYASKIKR